MKNLWIVDDEAQMTEVLCERLEKRGYPCRSFTRAQDALNTLDQEDPALVVTDLNMPDLSGIDFCRRLVEARPNLPVIVLTAFGSLETAVAAIRAGAYDFLTKPVDLDALTISLDRALERTRLREEVRRLRLQVEAASDDSSEMVAESPAMRELTSMIRRVADTPSSVLITGESGTGKELVARALHDQSGRADKPFVAVNCAALPDALLESTLFGHVRGAFTDAHSSRDGLFVQADGGTLFLDEVGDLPTSLQPKLLRVLEEQKVRPIGGEREIQVDVRLLAATHQDLEAKVQTAAFREDLYFRLNVIELRLPPLRDRGRDVLLLAQHFVERFASRSNRDVRGLSAEACHYLLHYDWPGNVRELRNYMERAVVLALHDEITPEDLPPRVRAAGARPGASLPAALQPGLDARLGLKDLPSMEALEARYIALVLEHTEGNKSQAAKILDFDRTTLYRKIDRYELDLSSLESE